MIWMFSGSTFMETSLPTAKLLVFWQSHSMPPEMKSATTASIGMPRPAMKMPVWPVARKSAASPRAMARPIPMPEPTQEEIAAEQERIRKAIKQQEYHQRYKAKKTAKAEAQQKAEAQ